MDLKVAFFSALMLPDELRYQQSCLRTLEKKKLRTSLFHLDSNPIDKIKEMWPFNCHSLPLWLYLPERKSFPSGHEYTLSRKMSIIMKVQRTCPFLLFNTEGTTIKPSGPYPSVLGTAPVTTSAIKLNKAITSHDSEIRVRVGFCLSLEPLNLPFTPLPSYVEALPSHQPQSFNSSANSQHHLR